MKQILQNLSNGETSLVDIPCPKNIKSNILIATSKTVVSAGTERMLVDFGKASYIKKAKQQPDKVKMVLNKVLTDGLMTTVDAVKSKLDQPLPLGYCNAGVILESDVDGFELGDRVDLVSLMRINSQDQVVLALTLQNLANHLSFESDFSKMSYILNT